MNRSRVYRAASHSLDHVNFPPCYAESYAASDEQDDDKAIQDRDAATLTAILDEHADAIETFGEHNRNVRDAVF